MNNIVVLKRDINQMRELKERVIRAISAMHLSIEERNEIEEPEIYYRQDSIEFVLIMFKNEIEEMTREWEKDLKEES